MENKQFETKISSTRPSRPHTASDGKDSQGVSCICQEAKIPADRQHKQVQAEHLLHAAQSWEAAGSTGREARDSPAPSPSGASLPSCGSPATPSRKGAHRSCRNCDLGLVQKWLLFVCLGSSQEGRQGRKRRPGRCHKQLRAAGFHFPSA